MTISRPWRPFGLLGLFLLLHVLNQVDRNLIASFGPEIIADLKITRTQFSIASGLAFTVPYALTALTAGILADKYGRTRIMAAGLVTWSGFTAFSGMARSCFALAAVRPFVATGEATLIPAATAVLSERFPVERRATAIGVFFMGLPLGVGASFFIAGQLGPILGWRNVFIRADRSAVRCRYDRAAHHSLFCNRWLATSASAFGRLCMTLAGQRGRLWKRRLATQS